MSTYSQGPGTLVVPFTLHKENRTRLIARFQTPDVPKNSVILLKGALETPVNDTDIDNPFEQDSWFFWAFGVAEPGFYGMIDMNGKATLFMPKIDPALQPILGRLKLPQEFKDRYEVEEVLYDVDIPATMAKLDPDVIYVLSGVNSDSGIEAKPATFPGMENMRTDHGKLRHEMMELRVIKTKAEIEVMRYAAKVSADAQKATMRACKPGMYEYQLEATFNYHMYFHGGCRYAPYGPIVGSGPNSAVLHYGHAGLPNGRQTQDGELVLVDMGAEYHGYDGDLTCTYPVNGKFTKDQRDVYETVYAMLRGVEAAMKPGVHWPDMHRLSYRIMCEELKKRGFLKGDVEGMLAAHVPALLMPHGLGHLLGLDTHDVGGYPRGGHKRIMEPGIKKLRSARHLQPGMITTVEPGVYFNAFALEPAFKDPVQGQYLVEEKLRQFLSFGGVRLEDDVLVTETGCEILDDVPRTIDEIEKFMAAK